MLTGPRKPLLHDQMEWVTSPLTEFPPGKVPPRNGPSRLSPSTAPAELCPSCQNQISLAFKALIQGLTYIVLKESYSPLIALQNP